MPQRVAVYPMKGVVFGDNIFRKTNFLSVIADVACIRLPWRKRFHCGVVFLKER